MTYLLHKQYMKIDFFNKYSILRRSKRKILIWNLKLPPFSYWGVWVTISVDKKFNNIEIEWQGLQIDIISCVLCKKQRRWYKKRCMLSKQERMIHIMALLWYALVATVCQKIIRNLIFLHNDLSYQERVTSHYFQWYSRKKCHVYITKSFSKIRLKKTWNPSGCSYIVCFV